MMTTLTPTGWLAIGLLAFMFWQHDLKRFLISPFVIISLLHFRFFGFDDPTDTNDPTVDWIIAGTYVWFSLAYYLGQRSRLSSYGPFFYRWLVPGKPIRPIFPRILQRYQARGLLIVIGLYTVTNLYMNSVIYGSLSLALVRFYSGTPVETLPGWVMKLVGTAYWVALLSVFILRFNYKIYKVDFWVWGVAITLALFVAIPQGAVGGIVAPVSSSIIADILYMYRLRKPLHISRDLAILAILTIMTGAVVLAIRNTHFDSPSSVIEHLTGDQANTSAEYTRSVGHSHSIVASYAHYCFWRFGQTRDDFLWMNTLTGIITAPIPRAYWPDKPYSFGLHLRQMFQEDTIGYSTSLDSGYSIAAGMAGEGYANGGAIGILALSTFFGFLCGCAGRFAFIGFSMPSYICLTASMAFFRFSIMFVRGGMLDAWTATVYPIVMLIFCVKVSQFILYKKEYNNAR